MTTRTHQRNEEAASSTNCCTAQLLHHQHPTQLQPHPPISTTHALPTTYPAPSPQLPLQTPPLTVSLQPQCLTQLHSCQCLAHHLYRLTPTTLPLFRCGCYCRKARLSTQSRYYCHTVQHTLHHFDEQATFYHPLLCSHLHPT